MKKLFLLVLVVFTTILTFAQAEKYSKVKIYTDDQGMQKLSSLGLAVDEGIYRKGVFFISDFSSRGKERKGKDRIGKDWHGMVSF